MILDIIKILKYSHWINCGEAIDIAKGKNKLPTNFKEFKQQFKREVKWLLKKQ